MPASNATAQRNARGRDWPRGLIRIRINAMPGHDTEVPEVPETLGEMARTEKVKPATRMNWRLEVGSFSAYHLHDRDWTLRPLNPDFVMSRELSEGARLTLIVLVYLADQKGVVAVQTKDLVSMTGVHERQLQRFYRELGGRGYLRDLRTKPTSKQMCFEVDFRRVVVEPTNPAVREGAERV